MQRDAGVFDQVGEVAIASHGVEVSGRAFHLTSFSIQSGFEVMVQFLYFMGSFLKLKGGFCSISVSGQNGSVGSGRPHARAGETKGPLRPP